MCHYIKKKEFWVLFSIAPIYSLHSHWTSMIIRRGMHLTNKIINKITSVVEMDTVKIKHYTGDGWWEETEMVFVKVTIKPRGKTVKGKDVKIAE